MLYIFKTFVSLLSGQASEQSVHPRTMLSGLSVFIELGSGKDKGLGLRQKESRLLYCDSVGATKVKDSDVSAVLNCHTP
jgi:hypothetical protein